MQAVEFLPRRIALHPRRAGIDHVTDAGHRQRRLGHVGGEHQSALRPRLEDAILILGRQARVQRQHFRAAVFAPRQRQMRVANFAFARQEHQHVAERVVAGDFVHCGDDGVVHRAVARFFTLAFRRAIAYLDGIAASFHAHHRRVAEVFGETLGVDGGGGNDQLEVAPLAHQLLEVAEQEVDVEAALVRFVDNDRVVLRQPAIALHFRQQDAVGHELDVGAVADVLGEAHLITDRTAERRFQFLGHAPRHRAGGDAARLRATDHAGDAAAGGKAKLGQLRGLAGTGFAGNHHHLVLADQRDDLLGIAADR